MSGPVASVFNTFWEWEPQAAPGRARAYSDSVLGGIWQEPCKDDDKASETTRGSSWDTDSELEVESSHFDTDDETDAPALALRGWRCGLEERERKREFRTTLVLKRLPSNVNRAALCQMLDAAGFAGLYDFLYLPVNFKTWRFFRYCMVNFASPEAAAAALERLNGPALSWPMALGEDESSIEAAWCEKGQGLAVHLEQYRNSPVMHLSVPDEFKPILLCNGCRVAFPPPTATLVAPNTRKGR